MHFINCSDVYEGLLMKGGLYGLESWRDHSSVELVTFNGHEGPPAGDCGIVCVMPYRAQTCKSALAGEVGTD